VSSEFWYLLGPAAVAAIDRTTIGGSDEPVSQSPRPSIRWRVELEGGESIAACQNRVVVGGDREVLIVAADSGQVKQRMPVDGKALGVAISDRKCYVSTTTGRIYCFGEDGREDVQADEQTDEQTDGPPVTDGRVTADGAVPADGAAIGSAGEAVNGESQSHDHAPPLNDLLPEFASVAETMQLGYGVILGTDSDALVEGLLRDTKLHLLVLEQDLTRIDAFRRRWIGRGLYGTRLAALHVEPSRLSLATGFANLVAVGGGDLTWDLAEAKRLLSPARGYGWFGDQPIVSSPDADPSRGKWTHLYGSPANTAFTDDSQITDRLQLQWFGGPGPRRMVDRHLRAAAPLAQDGLMIVPGENRLIGVDSFNGTELWELDVPDSQRYTIPYDSGYYGLEKGRLAIAVKHDAWIVDTATGTVNERVALSDLPEVAPLPPAARWGYLALQSGRLYGSAMKPDAARLEPSRRLIEIDYGNQQPLVTSNVFFCLAPSPDPAESAENATGWNVLWSHEACILHPTICVTDQFVWFVQSRHPSMVTHPSGRIPLADLLAADAKLVCLDARTGRLCWERALPAELNECTNILYVQANDAALVVSGSLTQDNDTLYRLAVLDPTSGELRWQTEHFEGKPDAFAHGEQVHHPVVMHDRVIAEPYIYRLSDGQRVLPFGVPGDWRMVRPGHSCGTLTASRECVFFRATNPTMMSLSSGTPEFQRMQKLAPSRPGCWINIIPADGLVLIPEASASCVCAFSLQTSMAFAPASSK
jgi:outer membrane protein assembly factor BamB